MFVVSRLELKLPGEGNLNPSHSYQFDGSASNRCPEPGEGSQVNRRAPELQHEGIPATPAGKSAASGPNLNASMQTHVAWGIKRS